MDVTTGLAAYQRVVESIKGDISSGRLTVGEKLPGNRALAEQHQVALGTLQKALKVLQDEGWLISTPAVGVFVSDRVTGGSGGATSVEAIMRQLDQLQATVEALGERVGRLENERA